MFRETPCIILSVNSWSFVSNKRQHVWTGLIFLWDLTWLQGRFMKHQNLKKILEFVPPHAICTNSQIRIEKPAKICLYYCFKKLTKVIFHIYIMPVCFVCSNTNMLNFQPVKKRMGRMRKRKRKIKLKRRGGQIHCAPLVFAQGIYWTVATSR